MRMAADAVRLAEERGLRDRIVFFLEGWVPYDRRWNYLRDADAGVSAHFDDLESRFAFRTRLLDCFWAGLPVVTTRGDSLGDLVEARGLGRTVPPGDVDGWVDALAATLDGHDRPALDASLARVREELAWERVVEPLERLLALAKQAEPPRRLLLDDGTGYVRMRIQHAVLTHGARGAAARAARRLAERVTFRSGHGQ
jgi:glycosyltransferase involved in cell wall biosynthesis